MRSHDTVALAAFLPYMKLLLSGLYQLPLTQVPTYRGVKLALCEVSGSDFVMMMICCFETLLGYILGCQQHTISSPESIGLKLWFEHAM